MIGVPGKVIGFQGSDVTDTQLKFSWSPSYHVEGIPLCCNKYSISITNDTGTQIINNNTTITDTHIIIDTHPKQLCSVYVIEISAHNNVGQGETMTIKWSLGGKIIIIITNKVIVTLMVLGNTPGTFPK